MPRRFHLTGDGSLSLLESSGGAIAAKSTETNGASIRLPTLNRSAAWTIANLSQSEKWTLQELHTEEGRLDEVFRSITMPDTATANAAN